MNSQNSRAIDRAVEAIQEAEALLIGAGAGMGVDSGMPDFRGDEGFWKAYPAFKGKRFAEMSNPAWFQRDPELAWGFFGHRFNLYSKTEPHDGFQILLELAKSLSNSVGVFTSNVDGHFQASGFDESSVVECHGSIRYLQCSNVCSPEIWAAGNLELEVGDDVRLKSPLPRCHHCGAIARPNILMFGDYAWIPDRTERQEKRFTEWLASVKSQRLVVIEMGAGTAIPTVRIHCESAGGTLIRINPRDPEVPAGAISIPLGALEALSTIHNRLAK